VDAKSWTEQALASLLTLWEPLHHSAWRDSRYRDRAQHEKKSAIPERYYPTATFQAISAFARCGLWLPSARANSKNGYLEACTLRVSGGHKLSTPRDVLVTLLGDAGNDATIKKRVEKSANAEEDEQAKSRFIVTLSRCLVALDDTFRHVERSTLSGYVATLAPALRWATLKLIEPLRDGAGPALLGPEALFHAPFHAPDLVFYVAEGLTARRRLLDLFIQNKSPLDAAPDTKHVEEPIEKLLQSLPDYFTRLSEKMMARRGVPFDADHDVTSLTFAISGLSLLRPSIRRTAFFRACLDTIARAQGNDGCWPAGVSFAYSSRGDSYQTPSVEVALRLADAVFRQAVLISFEVEEIQLIAAVLPVLRKTARYLSETHVRGSGHDTSLTGWSSDRVRWPSFAETWITAFAAQLFHTIWLAERAVARADTLRIYAAEMGTAHSELREADAGDWTEGVVEPDAVLKPAYQLKERFIKPIRRAALQGEYFRRPDEDGVSFILYGPPGSGKTFLLKEFAASLGWPLISLNPGHFIRSGLEMIESTSAKIFADLQALDHAVILLDECDELFRDRAETEQSARSILSFVTACMLPKLQELHDARRVIFVLGTNYLRRIDDAVRRPGRFDAILLLDRPDNQARKVIIERQWPAAATGQVATLTNETIGWMTKDIIRAARRAASGGSKVVGISVTDYRDWCSNDGPEELKASRDTKGERQAVEARWKDVVKACSGA
jgi:hypothetical protein